MVSLLRTTQSLPLYLSSHASDPSQFDSSWGLGCHRAHTPYFLSACCTKQFSVAVFAFFCDLLLLMCLRDYNFERIRTSMSVYLDYNSQAESSWHHGLSFMRAHAVPGTCIGLAQAMTMYVYDRPVHVIPQRPEPERLPSWVIFCSDV